MMVKLLISLLNDESKLRVLKKMAVKECFSALSTSNRILKSISDTQCSDLLNQNWDKHTEYILHRLQ